MIVNGNSLYTCDPVLSVVFMDGSSYMRNGWDSILDDGTSVIMFGVM